MAIFYVLPSRHALGQRYSELLSAVFPGTRYTQWDWPDLAESLAALIEAPGDASVVYREDIDKSMGVRETLVRQFGARPGDQVVVIGERFDMTAKNGVAANSTRHISLELLPPRTATPVRA